MNAPTPARPRVRAVMLAVVAAAALACSSKYASDVTTGPALSGRALSTAAPGGPTYFEFQVDKQVTSVPGGAVPRYPSILRSAGVEGDVVAMFVVDSSGLAEPSSLKVTQSTHQLFTDAVRTALPGMRFSPAQVHGQRVKQLVKLPFSFRVEGSDSSTVPAAAVNSAPGPNEVLTLPLVTITVPRPVRGAKAP